MAKSNQSVITPAFRQIIRTKLTTLLKNNFSSTLGTVPDIVNLCMSLTQRESGFNTLANSGAYGGSHEKKVLAYPSVNAVYSTGTALQRANIKGAISARGLMQCTGYYALKKAGPSGKCELERLRPDLAIFTVPIGSDISAVLNGEATIDNQLTAGLIILEDKYVNVAPKLVANKTYSDRITASLAAYLGLGASDKFGTTPQAYANSIIRGTSYSIANGGIGPDGTPLVAGKGDAKPNSGSNAAGPTTTVASGDNQGPPGC